jgi:hypothetical protein
VTALDGVVQATWDGKNFAVVQMLPLPREDGRPYAEVDAHWNLTLKGIPVRPGAIITADPVSGYCGIENGYVAQPDGASS